MGKNEKKTDHIFRLSETKRLIQPVLQLLRNDVSSMLAAVHDAVSGPAELLDARRPYVMRGVHLLGKINNLNSKKEVTARIFDLRSEV